MSHRAHAIESFRRRAERGGSTKELHRLNRPTLLGAPASEEGPRDAEAESEGHEGCAGHEDRKDHERREDQKVKRS